MKHLLIILFTLITSISFAQQKYVVKVQGQPGIYGLAQTFDNITGTPTTLSMTTVGTYTVQDAGGSWLVISKL